MEESQHPAGTMKYSGLDLWGVTGPTWQSHCASSPLTSCICTNMLWTWWQRNGSGRVLGFFHQRRCGSSKKVMWKRLGSKTTAQRDALRDVLELKGQDSSTESSLAKFYQVLCLHLHSFCISCFWTELPSRVCALSDPNWAWSARGVLLFTAWG